jgi:hypothetical protein
VSCDIQQVLQALPNAYVLVVSQENIANNWHPGFSFAIQQLHYGDLIG